MNYRDPFVYDYSRLKRKIKEKYLSQARFAKELGIGESTLNLKLNNKAEWSQDEMRATLLLLGEEMDTVRLYFFSH